MTPLVGTKATPWLLGIGLFLLAALGGFAMLMRRRRPHRVVVDRRQPRTAPQATQAPPAVVPQRAAALAAEPVAAKVSEEPVASAGRTPHRLTRAAHPVVTDGAAHPVAKARAHPVKRQAAQPAEPSTIRNLEHA
jgi:hypothetical protein